jgi:hypothetical protein
VPVGITVGGLIWEIWGQTRRTPILFPNADCPKPDREKKTGERPVCPRVSLSPGFSRFPPGFCPRVKAGLCDPQERVSAHRVRLAPPSSSGTWCVFVAAMFGQYPLVKYDYPKISSTTELPPISGAELTCDQVQGLTYRDVMHRRAPRTSKGQRCPNLHDSNLFSGSRQLINHLHDRIVCLPHILKPKIVDFPIQKVTGIIRDGTW